MFQIIKRIINWTGPYKKRVYIGFVFSLLDAFFGIFPIMVAAVALNLLLEDQNGTRPLTGTDILIMLVILVAGILMRWLFSYLRASRQDSIAYEKTADERMELGNILKRVPLGFFQKHRTGDLTVAMTTDLAFFETQGMHMIDVVVNGYLYTGVSILSFLFFEPVVALICLGGIAVSSIGLWLIQKKSRKAAPVHQQTVNEMTSATIEYIRGMPVVKSFGKAGIAYNGVSKAYQDAKDINIRAFVKRNFYRAGKKGRELRPVTLYGRFWG